jgi:hypothetical protein
MSNKIFEEAIADAKLLREVAEANAKKAVLEAVTPKIREFIESELLEGQNTEEDELEEVVHEDELTLDESALQKLSILLGLNDKNVNAEIVSEASKLAYSKLDLNQKKELNIIADKIKKTKRTLESNVISNKDVNLKENSKMKEKFYEVDLKALREAVEEELSNAMEGEDIILRSLLRKKNEGTYFDIGSSEPIRNSNTYLLYKNGWQEVIKYLNQKGYKVVLISKEPLNDTWHDSKLNSTIKGVINKSGEKYSLEDRINDIRHALKI